MTRIVLQYVLPLLLPTLVFIGWLALTRKSGETREETTARLLNGPWFWLVVAGFALMAAGLVYLGLSSGSTPDSAYVPPRFDGGQVIPGHMK